jgi:hypothetical protein
MSQSQPPGNHQMGLRHWPRTGAPPTPVRLQRNQGLIWLSSFPRSGNTWLRTFISNVLDIAHGRRLKDINQIERTTVSEAWTKHFEEIIGRDPHKVDRATISKARPLVQARLATKAPGLLFVKTHVAAVRMDGVFTINWNVTRGAVYVVRNPLDVVCSYAPHYGLSLDEAIERMGLWDALAWGKAAVPELVGSWSQNVSSWTDKKLPMQPHIMRYEDMVDKPQETFSAFVRRIGSGITEEQIAQAIEASSFEQLQKQEQTIGFGLKPQVSTEAFFRRGHSGQWRETLTPAQIDRVVSMHHTQMERFGYLP